MAERLRKHLEEAIEELDLAGRSVAVAVSGGVDSVCLLHALWSVRNRHRLSLSVAHVNHGLRGEESESDAAFVCELAAGLEVPAAVRRIDPEALRARQTGRARLTLQEAARKLRYEALREMAEELGAERIATAHHRNDQVETVFLRLLRGTGPDGLGGIPERSHGGRVVRPLLRAGREDVVAYACENRLEWREDASNANLRYRRNALRATWLPKLAEEFNPQLLNAVAQLADAQRRDSAWIEELVAAEADRRFQLLEGEIRISRGGWEEVPEALALRLARRAIQEMGRGREVTGLHLERVVAFWRQGRTGSRIELPGHLVMWCERGQFRLCHAGADPGGVVS